MSSRDPELSHFLLQHLDAPGRELIAGALRAVEVLDGFGLYIVATRAARQLVALGYVDRVEMRSGRTLTVILPGSVQRVELPETVEQFSRRLTDNIRGQ